MRGFQEIRGQSIRLDYDRERAEFGLKAGPAPVRGSQACDRSRGQAQL